MVIYMNITMQTPHSHLKLESYKQKKIEEKSEYKQVFGR